MESHREVSLEFPSHELYIRACILHGQIETSSFVEDLLGSTFPKQNGGLVATLHDFYWLLSSVQ